MWRAGLLCLLLAIPFARAQEEESRECTCEQGSGSYLYLRCPKPAPLDPDPCPATHHGIHPGKPLPAAWNNLCTAQPRMGCFLRRHAASWGISCSLCATEKCCPFPNCANCPECHGEKADVPAGHQAMAEVAKEQQALFKEPLEVARSANYLAITDLKWLKIAVPGGEQRLATAGAAVVDYQPDWRIRLLSAITDPGVAYILMLIGIYGLLLEFYMPGAVAPGVIGGICLLVAMFAFHLLPVSYTGFALILFGIGLLVAEHFVAGFGILGFGGVVAFAIGSVMLIDTDAPGFSIPLGLIAGATAVSALFLLTALYLALRARKRPVVSGREQIVGATGEIVEDSGRETYARIEGEVWEVRSSGPLNRGETVRVTGIDGLVLVVEPARKGEGS